MDYYGRQWIVNVLSWDNSTPTPGGRLPDRGVARRKQSHAPGGRLPDRGVARRKQSSAPLAKKKGPVSTGPFAVDIERVDQSVGADGCKAGGVDELSPDGGAGVLSGVVDDGDDGAGVDGPSVELLPAGGEDGSAEGVVALSCEGAIGGAAELSAGFSPDGVVVVSGVGLTVLPSDGGVALESAGGVGDVA